MSFDSLLRHRLVRIREVAVLDLGGDPTYTEYGQPILAPQESDPFRGLLRPLTAREVTQFSQAGAVVTDLIVDTRLRDLRTADTLRLEPDDGRRYTIKASLNAAGQDHHLMVLVSLVETGAVAAAVGS